MNSKSTLLFIYCLTHAIRIVVQHPPLSISLIGQGLTYCVAIYGSLLSLNNHDLLGR